MCGSVALNGGKVALRARDIHRIILEVVADDIRVVTRHSALSCLACAAILPDCQPELAVDDRKHQGADCCVVKSSVADFLRLVAEVLGVMNGSCIREHSCNERLKYS